jgi:hypothetical protein
MFKEFLKVRKKQFAVAMVLVTLYLIVIGKLGFEETRVNFLIYYFIIPNILAIVVLIISKILFGKY